MNLICRQITGSLSKSGLFITETPPSPAQQAQEGGGHRTVKTGLFRIIASLPLFQTICHPAPN